MRPHKGLLITHLTQPPTIVPLGQIYVALTTATPIAIQFGDADQRDFRIALNSSGDGRARIEAALNTICAGRAQASVPTDREYILGVVEREMGLAKFNEFIRNGIRREYANINKNSAFQ